MMTKHLSKIILLLIALVIAAGGAFWYLQSANTPNVASSVALRKKFEEILESHRKVIVLLAHEDKLSAAEKDAAGQVGQELFHENTIRIDNTSAELEKLLSSGQKNRFDVLEQLIDYIENDENLFDADRLVFREILNTMQLSLAKEGALPAVKLHKRVSDDLEALNEIERTYEKEMGAIFSRFDMRAIQVKRERWEDYLTHLAKRYSREQVLKEQGVIVPYDAKNKPATAGRSEGKKNILGYEIPEKTLVLTFDDGPHPRYTNEIKAILQQYRIPGVFFNIGRNLGEVKSTGEIQVSNRGEVSRQLVKDGFVLANHSYTHARLSRVSGKNLYAEIENTDKLLLAVDPNRSSLFRFPYGAENREAIKILSDKHLQSMMWNIDSLDWADPVPRSIIDRVLRNVEKEGRGIVLFHDIHERTVKALPMILDRLIAEGYQFAGWDGKGFHTVKANTEVESKQVSSNYSDSWAIVIGIDQYQKWPQLHYAVNDAQSIRKTLIERFGFASDHVFSLTNAGATRNAILSAFHDRLAHGDVQKDDRVFVFFAGHGATRQLSSGRELGYIIPVDSDPEHFETDAIPMSDIQNIAESLTAKHMFFVMDSCYSGLALTRGMNSTGYLRDNAKRLGRQMLTAGGADQLVTDGGPNGHSIFTWTLLQGLEGKGDLNHDGFITATELAAYVAPAVANLSAQTPAFGSLPGSQGGEFIFEMPSENEYISEQTSQLGSDAIAMNQRIEPNLKTQPDESVVVNDLHGVKRQIELPQPVSRSQKQQAQLANDRGLQFYKELQYGEAEAQFTEALRLRPDFALAANNLGFVFFKQGKVKEAALWFENTIKIDRSRAIAYLNLGEAYTVLGERQKAVRSFKTYLELAPHGKRVNYAKAQLLKLDTL